MITPSISDTVPLSVGRITQLVQPSCSTDAARVWAEQASIGAADRQMTKRELFEDAKHQVATYKNPPNINRARFLIDRIIVAAGFDPLNGCDIESITEKDGEITIVTRHPDGDHNIHINDGTKFPSSIIDATDPVAAARAWRAQQELQSAKERVERLKATLSKAEAELAALQS